MALSMSARCFSPLITPTRTRLTPAPLLATEMNSMAFASSCRYKMISEFTWPNHDLGSDKDAVKRLLQGCGFDHDVAYGKTKVFVRTPRTLFSLEEQRAEMVQRIVLFLQKVRIRPGSV